MQHEVFHRPRSVEDHATRGPWWRVPRCHHRSIRTEATSWRKLWRGNHLILLLTSSEGGQLDSELIYLLAWLDNVIHFMNVHAENLLPPTVVVWGFVLFVCDWSQSERWWWGWVQFHGFVNVRNDNIQSATVCVCASSALAYIFAQSMFGVVYISLSLDSPHFCLLPEIQSICSHTTWTHRSRSVFQEDRGRVHEEWEHNCASYRKLHSNAPFYGHKEADFWHLIADNLLVRGESRV